MTSWSSLLNGASGGGDGVVVVPLFASVSACTAKAEGAIRATSSENGFVQNMEIKMSAR